MLPFSSNRSGDTSKLNKTTNRDISANQFKFSDVLMSGAALVSKEPGGSNAAQRFVVLTSNLLCCYKEFGIGPSPTDAIEVGKIVSIHISFAVLSLTVTSSQQP